MTASNDWNTNCAAVIGATCGAVYAFAICDLANLLSLPMMSTVVLVTIVGGALGAALLSGIASLLNHARAFDSHRLVLSSVESVSPDAATPSQHRDSR